MKKLFILFLLLTFAFQGKAQNKTPLSQYKTPGFSEDFVHESRYFYNWHDVETAFIARTHISYTECVSFFNYAFGKGLLSMNDYLQKVKNGSINKTNALQYWLDKLLLFEKVYNENYTAFASQNNSNAKQGNNTVLTGGANCNNLDFSTGNSNGWTGQWNNVGGTSGAGVYGGLTVTGFNSSGYNKPDFVHEFCTGGNDPNVPISTLPPGHNFSLRLGDDSAYRILKATNNTPFSLPFNHQVASNTFLVTQANQTITYWYAVVLCQYNPNNHTSAMQPYFKIRMYDGSGNEILCAHYDVDGLTAANIGGFQLDSTHIYNAGTGVHDEYDFYYKNWSPVTIPLTNFIGQNVTLTFETSDCAGGGHPGYAYVTADCAPLPAITFAPLSCSNPTTVLTAPPGLATYSWSGPGIVGSATNQTVTINAGGTYTVNMTTIGNSGITCNLQLDTFIQNFPVKPVATFSALPVCLGNPTVFTNVTPGVFNNIMWIFGDGTKDSTNTVPTHTYAAPGTYTVSLYLNNGCTDTYTATVTVNPSSTATFSATTVCQGTPTVFTNTSTGGTSYQWDFGDGSAHSTVQNPTHTYATSGVFAVTLTVTNSFNCNSKITNSVTVNPMPVGIFSATSVCLGNPTVFTNSSTPATGVIYSWNFGDPSVTTDTSSIKNPTYTYPSIGTYSVSLQITATGGCSVTVNHTVTVNTIPSLTVTPLPAYCWGDPIPQVAYTLTPTNANLNWTNTNTQIGLPSSGVGMPGGFVAGQNNTLANISGVITITPSLGGCAGPPAVYTVTIKPTPVVFHASVDYCPNKLTNAITFTATPNNSTIAWTNTTPGTNIGLGTSSGTTTLPSFTTIDPGNTMASDLISVVATLNGCVGPMTTFSINVNPNPVASFTNSVACDGAGTIFTDQSTIGSGSITQWGWDMNNDGIFTDATQQNPAYVLTPVGDHTVGLMVTSNKGCSTFTTELVYVNPRPTITFVADTLSGCSPLSVQFTDVSSIPFPDNLVKWIWDFGNGTIVTNTSSVPVSANYGNNTATANMTYNVSLTVISNVGCASKLTKNGYITVYPIPKAGFSYSPPDADILDPMIYFHDESLGANGPNAYYWDLGDLFNNSNNSSTLANPTHEYSDQFPYTYFVTQYVQNAYGCKDSIREPVIIRPSITFYVPNAFSPNYDGINDGFKGTGIGIDNTTYNLWIFDRWGNEIWHSTDMELSWDGKIKGTMAQEDTYVWKVYFRDIEKKEHNYKGVVSLLK